MRDLFRCERSHQGSKGSDAQNLTRHSYIASRVIGQGRRISAGRLNVFSSISCKGGCIVACAFARRQQTSSVRRIASYMQCKERLTMHSVADR